MASKPKKQKKKDPVGAAIGLLIFIGVMTLVVGILSAWITALRAYTQPITAVLGVLFLITAYYAKKGSLLALTIGTTLFIADVAILLLLPLMGLQYPLSLSPLLIVKFFFIAILVWGVIIMQKAKGARRDLVKGILIGVGIYLAFFFSTLFIYGNEPISSADTCTLQSGLDHDNCIYTVVTQTREKITCGLIKDSGILEFCRAVADYNSSYCMKVLSNQSVYDYCMGVTSKENPSQYCNRITNKALRDECFMLTG